MGKSKNSESQSEFIIFKTDNEQVSVDVRMLEDDVWLTQKPIGYPVWNRTPWHHTTY
jgi:hypothetical protein